MGMNAVYFTIDDKTLDDWLELDEEALSRALSKLEEDKKTERLDLAKNWDLLHYWLTGTSASAPIEGNFLSEAVVGVHVFSEDEDSDFIACTEYAELPEMLAVLEKLEIKQLHAARLNLALLSQAELYPQGIEQTPTAQLEQELEHDLAALIKFYQAALDAQKHIIVSIL